jgi:hypothetical protein
MNNPLAGTDPTGYEVECADESDCVMTGAQGLMVYKDKVSGLYYAVANDGNKTIRVEAIQYEDENGNFVTLGLSQGLLQEIHSGQQAAETIASNGKRATYSGISGPEHRRRSIVESKNAQAGQIMAAAGKGAVIAAENLTPGVALAKCAFSGGCTASEWALAFAEVAPIGKLARLGGKLDHANDAQKSVDKVDEIRQPDAPKVDETPSSSNTCSIACQCFAAGTLVQTSEGLVPIEEIKAGDLVLAKDEATGKLRWQPVVETYVNLNRDVYEMVFVDANGATQTVIVTAGASTSHPRRRLETCR